MQQPHFSPDKSLPTGYVDAVTKSILSVFGQTWQLQVNAECPDPVGELIATVISFSGEYPWSMSLIAPRDTAEFIVKSYFDMDVPFDSPDMADAVGELINVVAGECVRNLDAQGIECQMGLPSVLVGTKMDTFHGNSHPYEARHFRTPAGYLGVGVTGA